MSVKGYLVFVPFENVASYEFGGTPTTPGSMTRPDKATVATTPGHLPLCGQPPEFAFGNDQAFCGNRNGCTLILWNPSLSLDDNLMDAGVVRFPEGVTDVPA